jgi:hypothetical protein
MTAIDDAWQVLKREGRPKSSEEEARARGSKRANVKFNEIMERIRSKTEGEAQEARERRETEDTQRMRQYAEDKARRDAAQKRRDRATSMPEVSVLDPSSAEAFQEWQGQQQPAEEEPMDEPMDESTPKRRRTGAYRKDPRGDRNE